VPLYEYDCRGCGHRFELLVRHSTEPAPAPACPLCESEDVERLLSIFAVSSESIRDASIQRARRTLAKSPNRVDRLHAEAVETREHLRDDYGISPPEKPKTIV
jgi:putative FmdB family regulatory protein